MATQLDNWFDDDKSLRIPQKITSPAHPEGRYYTVPTPDFETGLLLQQLGSISQRILAGVEVTPEEAKRLKLDDAAELDFTALILGPTLDELRADGVGWGPIKRVLAYAFTYYAVGPDAAERLIAPKAPEPTNRAAKRKKK